MIYLSPRATANYHEQTDKAPTSMNWSQRHCTGPCKRNRSRGQFDRDATVCKTCLARM